MNNIEMSSDEIKKGAWSSEEDSILTHYIEAHGEGRWSHLARHSGLKRTGKSCRLRWKNYLQPNIKRGNITLEEQLRIMELHCIYGNRWSKIAEFLPGRTDNEIKNYWKTRVHRRAKQLKYDVNIAAFKELVRDVWVPRLSEQVESAACDDHNLDDDSMVKKEKGDDKGEEEADLVMKRDLLESEAGHDEYHGGAAANGADSLAGEFYYSELWDVSLNDDYNYFWACP